MPTVAHEKRQRRARVSRTVNVRNSLMPMGEPVATSRPVLVNAESRPNCMLHSGVPHS